MTKSIATTAAAATMKYYVSVTGLQVKSMWHMPRFIYFVSQINASSFPGNIDQQFTGRNGVQHTLTVWNDRKSMMKFYASGPHAAAMKVTSQISTPGGTKVYGYYSNSIPTWDEALVLWDEHGAMHGRKPTRTAVTTTATVPETNQKKRRGGGNSNSSNSNGGSSSMSSTGVAKRMMVIGSSVGVISVLTVLLCYISQPEWILQTSATVNQII